MISRAVFPRAAPSPTISTSQPRVPTHLAPARPLAADTPARRAGSRLTPPQQARPPATGCILRTSAGAATRHRAGAVAQREDASARTGHATGKVAAPNGATPRRRLGGVGRLGRLRRGRWGRAHGAAASWWSPPPLTPHTPLAPHRTPPPHPWPRRRRTRLGDRQRHSTRVRFDATTRRKPRRQPDTIGPAPRSPGSARRPGPSRQTAPDQQKGPPLGRA